MKLAFWIWVSEVLSNVFAALTWPPWIASSRDVGVLYTVITILE